MFCDFVVLVALNKVGKVSFHLIGTNGFYVKEENEWFAAAGSRCHENLKYDNFTSPFSRLRQIMTPKSVPHV